MSLKFKATIMDRSAVEKTLVRIAHQIVEKNGGTDDLCLLGIRTGGIPLAWRVAANILSITGAEIPVGSLDISPYRDDISKDSAPALSHTDVPFSVSGKKVVLVDDVLYTGRTARAAMDALTDLGRPARIELFVLIDRGHSELPIRATYTGKNIPTSKSEVVKVKLQETDGETSVLLYENDLPDNSGR